ncbi:hypothetical protein HYPBUDRAFT_151786 [Hyphopichia burtonii NRRL Y-1933]|uniref:Uncharacterized protein n=1 Tax=Hyphopichia burtonii NRRL Y-1933 TaxID=984485 RepID=A0A1E4RT73_9ASCO|nr:hypothetical protein HYPBUDRAFT_151786 [Hyphopichia burtonii NRRL Y-1933]ODV70477.1 hypothetical protein HYPBUDRAFT_151786 [Hyphopichia burtonii NRRL Y-1933]
MPFPKIFSRTSSISSPTASQDASTNSTGTINELDLTGKTSNGPPQVDKGNQHFAHLRRASLHKSSDNLIVNL